MVIIIGTTYANLGNNGKEDKEERMIVIVELANWRGIDEEKAGVCQRHTGSPVSSAHRL